MKPIDGTKINDIRKEYGITIAQLADYLNISHRAVDYIISGETKNLSDEKITRLITLFNKGFKGKYFSRKPINLFTYEDIGKTS